MELHLCLKKERERQRKTAEEAAAYLGVSEDMVRRYDSARSDITLRQAAKYAEFLGQQLGDLLPSTKVRAVDLRPLLAALDDFYEEERPAMIENAARFLSATSAVANSRAARVGRESKTSVTTSTEDQGRDPLRNPGAGNKR